MGVNGVVAVDPETLETTWISADTVGHDVRVVAVDGDAVFVESDDRITALVDGEVRATMVAGGHLTWGYLGHVDGRFGFWAPSPPEGFTVLRPSDPMVVEVLGTDKAPVGEIDGDGWAQTGPLSVGRVRLLDDLGPVPTAPGWAGPVSPRGREVYPMSADDAGSRAWRDPADAGEGWVDIERVTAFDSSSQSSWNIELALEPPPLSELEPGVSIAYGLVLDATGDGVGDYLIGIDTNSSRPDGYHVWVTDLVTGETDERFGPPYGFPIEFRHPSEGAGDPIESTPPTMLFTFLPDSEPAGLDPASARFYAWASVTRDGAVTAWDYAPDTGWIGS